MTFCLKRLRSSAPVLLLALLSACSGSDVKDTLGMNRVAPDEFKVVSRPPLTVPPQFSLLPPGTESEGPAQQPASEQAKDVVMGATAADGSTTFTAPGASTSTTPVKSKPLSNAAAAKASADRAKKADDQFMQHFGADKADPNVRKELVEDHVSKQLKEEDESWWDIMSSPAPKAKDPMVDASQESDRIKDNADTGKPVNEGETPTVKEKDRGILGRLLGD